MLSATIPTMKHVKSKKQKDKETLTSVLKEMAQPRFAESARKEEEVAGHRGTGRASTHLKSHKHRRIGFRPGTLIVEDNAQQRTIDVKPAVVPDEAQFLEFVHEKIDP